VHRRGIRNQPALPLVALSVALAVAVWKAVSVAVQAYAPDGLRERLGALWAQSGAAIVLLGALLPVVAAAIQPMSSIRRRSTALTGIDREEAALYRWMRASSPKDAQFLTPPNMETMRFHGQRAIVVDWKSNPIVPGEVLEWYRRLKDVTDRVNFSSARDLDGYYAMDPARLEFLRARYHLDYVVLRRDHVRSFAGYRTVYTNSRFAVLDVHDKP
jgi:hypothetical protein